VAGFQSFGIIPDSKDALKIHDSGSATASAHDFSNIGCIPSVPGDLSAFKFSVLIELHHC